MNLLLELLQLNERLINLVVSIPKPMVDKFEQLAFKSNVRVKAQTHGPEGIYRKVPDASWYSVHCNNELEAKKFAQLCPPEIKEKVLKDLDHEIKQPSSDR